ncbi:hypothetical protein EJB05_45053, partial [Eragrostis curvula]
EGQVLQIERAAHMGWEVDRIDPDQPGAGDDEDDAGEVTKCCWTLDANVLVVPDPELNDANDLELCCKWMLYLRPRPAALSPAHGRLLTAPASMEHLESEPASAADSAAPLAALSPRELQLHFYFVQERRDAYCVLEVFDWLRRANRVDG